MSMTMSATYIYTHGAMKNKWKLPNYQHIEENDQMYIEFFFYVRDQAKSWNILRPQM